MDRDAGPRPSDGLGSPSFGGLPAHHAIRRGGRLPEPRRPLGRRRGHQGGAMKWVTRENANVDRIACPWLIKRFIDPEAEFLFVARDQVLEVAEREGAHSYDAQGAEYTHRDGKCSFDVLVEELKLGD